MIPPRPLTRVMARARNSNNNNIVRDVDTSAGTDSPLANEKATGGAKGSRAVYDNNAYRMEVNEYVRRPGQMNIGERNSLPCVTIRDLMAIIPDRKQRRVWIPVDLCGEIVAHLKTCRVEANTSEAGDSTSMVSSPDLSSEKDSRSNSVSRAKNSKRRITFDVSKLEEILFEDKDTGKLVEISHVDGQTRLRTFMDVPSKELYREGDFMEVIELRNGLLHRLIKFMKDVSLRYKPVEKNVQIPSLYSYSGERRFYYDLRDTRWGLRLHISQVTDLHRNVIGIPLESVVPFRDRLNQAIQALSLDEDGHTERKEAASNSRKGGAKSANGNRRGNRGRNYRARRKNNNSNNVSNSTGNAATNARSSAEDTTSSENKSEADVGATAPPPTDEVLPTQPTVNLETAPVEKPTDKLIEQPAEA